MNLLILVVDDEPDVEVLFRQHFRHDLRAGRFTMEFAQSAPLALQRINDASDRSLILILSDINMPGMTGLDLLPKAREARPDVPIIMITAYGDAETKRRALEGGAEALLTKPIDFVREFVELATHADHLEHRAEHLARVGSNSGSGSTATPWPLASKRLRDWLIGRRATIKPWSTSGFRHDWVTAPWISKWKASSYRHTQGTLSTLCRSVQTGSD